MYEGSFNFTDASSALNNESIPKIVNITASTFSDDTSSSILIDITMEKPGFIYFVADRNKMFTKDSADFDYLNITTSPVRPPTTEQIINCQNWRNSTS